MTQQPLTLTEIVAWYQSKRRLLEGSEITVVDIRERSEHLPAAAADLNGSNTMGRINGWVSGEFDFEVVRVSDGKDIFWRHVNVSAVDGLDGVYSEFIREMLGADDPPDGDSGKVPAPRPS
jgi:hypothetical protein